MKLLDDLRVIREELFGLRVDVASMRDSVDGLLRVFGQDRPSDQAAQPEES